MADHRGFMALGGVMWVGCGGRGRGRGEQVVEGVVEGFPGTGFGASAGAGGGSGGGAGVIEDAQDTARGGVALDLGEGGDQGGGEFGGYGQLDGGAV